MKRIITLGIITTAVYLFLPRDKKEKVKKEIKDLGEDIFDILEVLAEFTSVGTYKGHQLYQGPNGGIYYWSWGRKVYLRRRW